MNWANLFSASPLEFAIELVAVGQEAVARGFDATPAEIRDLFKELRYMRRLETAEAFKVWMAENCMALANIQSACDLIVKRRKLRDSISAEEITGHYAENRPNYERAEIYRICVEQSDVAHEIFSQIVEEEDSFFLLAIEQSTDLETVKMGGYVGEVSRKDLPGEVEAAVFGTLPGEVIGPVKTSSGWQILLVQSARTIPIDQVESEIRDHLLQEIVTKAVRRAEVIYDYAKEA